MENKNSNHNLSGDTSGSPLDTWKSSEGQTTKRGAHGEGKSYQQQVSTFEDEGNIPHNQYVRSMNNFNRYAEQGVEELKRLTKVSSEWIKENPTLAIGLGLGMGLLVGTSIRKAFRA